MSSSRGRWRRRRAAELPAAEHEQPGRGVELEGFLEDTKNDFRILETYQQPMPSFMIFEILQKPPFNFSKPS